MEKNFKGRGLIRSREKEVYINSDGSGNQDVVITRDGKEPHILYWNDDINGIGANVRRFNFDGKMPRDFKVVRPNGDSLFLNKDFQVFSFGGDSAFNFKFNADSLLKGFSFKMDGLDSNLRKRVITMHRDMVPGRPGGMILRGGSPGVFERGNLESFGNRNNSSSFNYSHTDKDGISSRMNIRMSDANKEQLKKITGSETLAKSLDVSDLTLFPNFSSGKMTLSFNVSSKGTAKVSVLDSDMKSIFTDDAANLNGNYIKQFALPKNGVYYVTINQNGNWFVKRLVKE
jgi:hypothetical protein